MRTAAALLLALWLRGLGDEDPFVREESERRLTAVGARVLPQVEPLLQSPDAEVRMRAARIIETIETGERRRSVLGPPVRVSVEARGEKFRDVLAGLARRTGFEIRVQDIVEDRPITADLIDVEDTTSRPYRDRQSMLVEQCGRDLRTLASVRGRVVFWFGLRQSPLRIDRPLERGWRRRFGERMFVVSAARVTGFASAHRLGLPGDHLWSYRDYGRTSVTVIESTSNPILSPASPYCRKISLTGEPTGSAIGRFDLSVGMNLSTSNVSVFQAAVRTT